MEAAHPTPSPLEDAEQGDSVFGPGLAAAINREQKQRRMRATEAGHITPIDGFYDRLVVPSAEPQSSEEEEPAHQSTVMAPPALAPVRPPLKGRRPTPLLVAGGAALGFLVLWTWRRRRD